MNQWLATETDDIPHVIPINDLRPHDIDDCWCNPWEDDGVMVHNSADRREEYENGRKPS